VCLQVRETLVLAAKLRRGVRRCADASGSETLRNESTRDADAAAALEVERALRRLGLSECADTLVVRKYTLRLRRIRARVLLPAHACAAERGTHAALPSAAVFCCRLYAHDVCAQGGDSGGHAVAGISGGERRRLAIGAPGLAFACAHMRKRAMPHAVAHSHWLVHLQAARRSAPARRPVARASSWQTSPPAVRTRAKMRKNVSHRTHIHLRFRFPLFFPVLSRSRPGLDSFQADRVVDALAALAHGDGGALVLAALHAPRSASFARIDDLLLLVCPYPPLLCPSLVRVRACVAR
jgi:hypothetical protein